MGISIRMRSKKIIHILFVLGLLLAIIYLFYYWYIYIELLLILSFTVLFGLLCLFLLNKKQFLSTKRHHLLKQVFISVFLLVNVA